MIYDTTAKVRKNFQLAAALRRKRQRKEEIDKQERAVRDARSAGYAQGNAPVSEMERLMAHPVAQQLLSQMGKELGRAVAEKAEENGTPGVIAFKCAEEVWSYIQKTGQPLEEAISTTVMRHMEDRVTRIRVDVPAMSFESRVNDFDRVRWG